MNIKLSGDFDGNNKIIFEKLLAKWDELFTRKSLFEEMESVETDKAGVISFMNENEELRFYQTTSDKLLRSDSSLSFSGIGKALSYIVGMKFLKENQEEELKQLEEPAHSAMILTDIIYEVNAEKRISFTFSKFNDSDDVILHFEFSDDESDTSLSSKIIASGDGKTPITLIDLFDSFEIENLKEHFSIFVKNMEACKQKLEASQNGEQYQSAFEALGNI